MTQEEDRNVPFKDSRILGGASVSVNVWVGGVSFGRRTPWESKRLDWNIGYPAGTSGLVLFASSGEPQLPARFMRKEYGKHFSPIWIGPISLPASKHGGPAPLVVGTGVSDLAPTVSWTASIDSPTYRP